MVFENMKSHYEESKTRDRRRRQKRRYSNPSDSGSSFEDMKQEVSFQVESKILYTLFSLSFMTWTFVTDVFFTRYYALFCHCGSL